MLAATVRFGIESVGERPLSQACPSRSLALLVGCAMCVTTAVPAVALADVPAQLSASSKPATEEYQVNPGDELDVFVWGEERMQRTVRVLPDGSFAFPLAGTIRAVNRPTREISKEIRDRLAVNYRTAPDVTVTVRETAGMRFYVVGKVRSPGAFSAGRSIDIIQALSLAGGLAEFADVKHAVILRATAAGQSVEPVRLAAVLKGGRALSEGQLASPLPTLRSGDVLVIP
jgi:polysaccharide export outer membrane protein